MSIDKAREYQMKIDRVINCMFKHSCLPATKEMCRFMGFDVGDASFPLKQFTDADRMALKADLDEIGWPFTK